MKGHYGLWSSCLFWILTTGCTLPEAASEELGDLSLYLFREFDNPEAQLGRACVDLEAEYLTGIDLAGDVNGRTVTPPVLTPEDWGGVDGVLDIDHTLQLPVAVGGVSRHDLNASINLVLEPNQVCVESTSTKYYHREYLTDGACFVDGSCDVLRTMNEVRKENFLAKMWFDLAKDYRLVSLDDGREAMIARAWTNQPFAGDSGANSFDQLYALEVWLPSLDDGETTQRYYSMWSSVTIPGVTDELYAGLVKSGMDEGYRFADDFIDGIMCANDRDREYDRF